MLALSARAGQLADRMGLRLQQSVGPLVSTSGSSYLTHTRRTRDNHGARV